jgi:DNA-binding PadR family transcriptional regulator
VVDTEHSGFGRYPLQNVALGLLMRGPKHGYGLYQDFTDFFGSIWKAGQTKFYVALTDLQGGGFLDATMEPQENRPARKVYHLTEAGREQFLSWLREPVRSMRTVRVEFIAKLRFFDLLGIAGAGALIDAQITVFQAMVDEWEGAVAGSGAVEADPFYGLVYDFRVRQARFIIEWLEACKTHVEADQLEV